ncbi:MAG: hypothetical protein IKY91_05805 [Akkermansia sp.]|nr:hypothetical protein [Akkermansia sp.]
MNDVVIVALIGACGSALGSIFGIVASSKLTQYRLALLEEKVDKHNKIVERTFVLEGAVKELTHEVADLKKYHTP